MATLALSYRYGLNFPSENEEGEFDVTPSELAWGEKLKRLQESLNLSNDTLASTLGITTRTLSDFLKPESEGGRQPSEPIKRLIDLLLGETFIKQPETNLVVIHSGFRAPAGDPATLIVQMHAAAGGAQRDNEFHYVSVDPTLDPTSASRRLESLVKMRVQPHFFADLPATSNNNAKDCYFSTLTVWLACQAMRRNLSHITIAADVMKFWPLARELKELLAVNVTFVREAEADIDAEEIEELNQLGINIVSPSGRKSGFIYKLIREPDGNVPYGFVIPSDSSGNPSSVSDRLFFSYNHMKKGRDGISDETPICDLNVGDLVTFAIGMNKKGACATDVALVGKESVSPAAFERGAPERAKAKSKEDYEFISILEDAIKVCGDENGWALLSSVGSRISVLHQDYKTKFLDGERSTIKEFAKAHPEKFEHTPNGAGTSYRADCLRLKK